jgi:phosphopantothenoylcysteine synthetase/decarboxylase
VDLEDSVELFGKFGLNLSKFTLPCLKIGAPVLPYKPYRIILVQAKHMYQSAKELDAANEEEDKGNDYDDDSDDKEDEEEDSSDGDDGDDKGGPASKKTSRKETALAI